MDAKEKKNPEDWNVYQTGTTHPKKKHGGLIALLLIAVIFLGGIASALGVWNVQMFRKLTQKKEAPPLAFSEDQEETTVPETQQASTDAHSDAQLSLHSIPQIMENIPQEGGLSLQEIYLKNIPSVVSVSTIGERSTSSGTGVVLTKDGYIVTNSHVIQDALSIQVIFSNDQVLDAKVVGIDRVSDLAVLYVNAYNLVPAEFGDSDALQVGDLAIAIGDPLGLELRGTMTDGIISAINRDITTGGRTMTLLQTNAALNSGNSGGPLLNCFGQVVGINTMKIGDFVSSGGVEGLGFAIPSTTVKEIVDQLISQGFVAGRPYLGITGQEVSPLYQQLYGLPQGIYISDVVVGSPAYENGIRPGDVLVTFDNQIIVNQDALTAVLYQHQAGEQVILGIYRDNQIYDIPLTVGQAQ